VNLTLLLPEFNKISSDFQQQLRHCAECSFRLVSLTDQACLLFTYIGGSYPQCLTDIANHHTASKCNTVEPLITDTSGEFKFCPL
jgi:hypothetical protein